MGELAGRIGARPLLIVGATLLAAGLLLALRVGLHSNYWTAVLPSVATLALGMTCSAAPLTSAILSAVDARHTGAASGLNSAVAQLGGVVAIALVGAVLATRGEALVRAFHVAAVAGAIVALAAAAAIVFLFQDAHRQGSASRRQEVEMPDPKQEAPSHDDEAHEGDDALDEALEETFPASDPISPMRPSRDEA